MRSLVNNGAIGIRSHLSPSVKSILKMCGGKLDLDMSIPTSGGRGAAIGLRTSGGQGHLCLACCLARLTRLLYQVGSVSKTISLPRFFPTWRNRDQSPLFRRTAPRNIVSSLPWTVLFTTVQMMLPVGSSDRSIGCSRTPVSVQ